MDYFRKVELQCRVCGNTFQIKPSQVGHKGGGKYCSKPCFYNRTKVSKICIVCSKAFVVPPVRKDTARYCSPKCQHSHQMKYKLVYFTCPECGRVFNTPPSHAKRNNKTFCSLSCSARFYRKVFDINGKNNPNWKGGITPIHQAIRTSSRYADWRTSIFKRDNYTCVICGEYGGRLEADHIKEFSKYPELVFELSNGRTLCYKCHKKTPNYGYRGMV